MSNLVMTLGSTQRRSGFEALEKWRDLGIDGTRNFNHRDMPEEICLSNYVQWLVTEHKEDIDGHEGMLSAFLAQNQEIEPDNPPEQLTAIAVCVKGGYDQAKDLYDMFMEPYRWRVSKLVNVKAVQSSIHHIFTWNKGERILNPEFGNKLRELLYEGITPHNIEQVKAEIMHCVSVWEPRANIVKIENVGDVNDTEDNTVHLEITYTIPELSNEQFAYSYYYRRGV